MKIFTVVLSILRPVRFLIVALTCALVFLSSAVPALAIGSYQSDPKEATTQLLETQKKTDETAKSAPLGLKKVQEESNKGLNEVQGDADINKMKRPENSANVDSVEDNVKNLLEKVTGKQ